MTIIAPCKDEVVTIHEILDSDDSARVETMLALYGELFPDYKHYIPRMRRRSILSAHARPGHISHYWLVEVDDKPVGLTTFRYVHSRTCGLGISFGLLPEARSISVKGQRLSTFIISSIMHQLLADAKQMGASAFYGLITEVEHLGLMEHYKRMGMLQLPINYLEPVFPSEVHGRSRQAELELVNFLPVILGITPNPEVGQIQFDRTALVNFALAFLVDHYGLPEKNLYVRSVLQSISEES